MLTQQPSYGCVVGVWKREWVLQEPSAMTFQKKNIYLTVAETQYNFIFINEIKKKRRVITLLK